MLNWRNPVIRAALHATRSDVPKNLRHVRRLSRSSSAVLENQQRENLRQLLLHAHQTVPYYRRKLEEFGVTDGKTVDFDSFEQLPLLTKNDVRSNSDLLRSTNPHSDTYWNTSGGTTGEPVEFFQDKRYWEWNVANKIFYQMMAGKPLGGREIKLWGSERDVRNGTERLSTRLRNFLYNRRLLDSFRMSESDLGRYVESINSFEPHTIWAYVESVHQIAKFVDRENIDVYSPEGIVTTAGTLYEPVRSKIESAFDATVHNQYGSREVGDVACECSEQQGLHVFSHTHYVEIVNDEGEPLAPNEEGYIAVTTLQNYSMPLIRYRIGDMGVMTDTSCPCGRSFPLLESVTGRVSDHFRTPDNDLIHGEYFTHLFYHRNSIRQFQVRQKSLRNITVHVVPNDDGGGSLTEELDEIRYSIEAIMGESVEVTFEVTDDIAPSASGKYRYTVSEV